MCLNRTYLLLGVVVLAVVLLVVFLVVVLVVLLVVLVVLLTFLQSALLDVVLLRPAAVRKHPVSSLISFWYSGTRVADPKRKIFASLFVV